jgi:L-glyceraldehyde 3-phosphate reductase
VPLLIHQPSYNILQRRIENGLFAAVERIGAGMIAFWALAQGVLSNRYLDGIPASSRAGRGTRLLMPEHITPDLLRKARALNELARARGQTLAQLAIAWVLRDPRMTSALVGASSIEQLRENLAAVRQLAFSAEELAAIDRIAGTAEQ